MVLELLKFLVGGDLNRGGIGLKALTECDSILKVLRLKSFLSSNPKGLKKNCTNLSKE